MRTCVACGAKRSKKEMVRFIFGEAGGLIRDDAGHGPGRGVYACRDSACVDRLVNRRRPEGFSGRSRRRGPGGRVIADCEGCRG